MVLVAMAAAALYAVGEEVIYGQEAYEARGNDRYGSLRQRDGSHGQDTTNQGVYGWTDGTHPMEPGGQGPVVDDDNASTALALARIWVSENGLRRQSDDQTAILEVLRDRARRMGVDILTAMRRYCPRSFDLHRTDARRWIAHLQRDGSQPTGWPTRLRWSTHEAIWRVMADRAVTLLSSEPTHICKKAPGHWAARSFQRPRLLGWEEVDCGDTSNAFYIRRVNPALYKAYKNSR